MGDFKTLDKEVRDLFLKVFTANCMIEDSGITPEEVNTIRQIDIHDVIENLTDLITNLITFKQEYINSNEGELVKRSEQFEALLQKSEAEVRNHISVEHQLKLHIESNQIISDNLELENNKHISEIKELQEKVKYAGKLKIDRKESKEALEKITRLEERLQKKQMVINKLETELQETRETLRMHIGDKEKYNYKGGKDKKEEVIEEIKKKFEEKAVGLQKLQKLIRESSAKTSKERNKVIRKSINDNDLSRNHIGEIKITSRALKAHVRSTSEHIRPRSVGNRPPSR